MLRDSFAAETRLTDGLSWDSNSKPASAQETPVRQALLVLSIILSALTCAQKFQSEDCRF